MTLLRQKLGALEASGKYVFHGTGEKLDILEPRQAHNRFDGIRRKDGPPAVFAATAVDYAIFMAVFSKKNCPLGLHTSVASWSSSNGVYSINFKASPGTMSQIDDSSSGWLYIFDKKDFHEREPAALEYISRKAVKPIERVAVHMKDIAGAVEVTDDLQSLAKDMM